MPLTITGQQKKECEAKMEQLEQSLQRKLRADTEQQVVKLRKEVEEEVIPQCAVVKEMRGKVPLLVVQSMTKSSF